MKSTAKNTNDAKTWTGTNPFSGLQDSVRVFRLVRGANTTEGNWRVIQERDENNTPTVSYTRGTDLSGTLEGAGGIGGLLARSHGYSSGNWPNHNYYHTDGNGNVTYLVTASQAQAARYRYDP